jgi:acyl-coenzyme A synthetase/AMP-(fatty) acid ligase
MQVSPSELEDALLEHPDGLVADAAVAGVLGPGRTPDERVPRAWVILSAAGVARGADTAVAALHEWARTRLSSYKQLRYVRTAPAHGARAVRRLTLVCA